MSGVRASSMKMLSASSTRAKFKLALHRGDQRRDRAVAPGGSRTAASRPAAAQLQPVAQEVEAELARRAVGDVAVVGGFALRLRHLHLQDADRQAEHLVDRSDPLGVALGQVVVDRGDVDTLAGQRVEERGSEAVSVLPSPVASSAKAPECMTTPAASCTSNGRMPSVRLAATQTRPNTSGSSLSSDSPPRGPAAELGGLELESRRRKAIRIPPRGARIAGTISAPRASFVATASRMRLDAIDRVGPEPARHRLRQLGGMMQRQFWIGGGSAHGRFTTETRRTRRRSGYQRTDSPAIERERDGRVARPSRSRSMAGETQSPALFLNFPHYHAEDDGWRR